MYFQIKNTLKNNFYHIYKHSLNLLVKRIILENIYKIWILYIYIVGISWNEREMKKVL
jgi:hypothetical protein